MRKLIEVCCCSTDDAINAYRGGADRIELNSTIEAGGLTPTLGCLRIVRARVDIPIITMIRPRTGGFCYTDLEFITMKEDAKIMLENGADGIAVGILNPDSTIDTARMQEMADICRAYGKEIVCHRAIDVTPDPVKAAETVMNLGFTRILTSGGQQRCLEGIDTINRMQECYGDHIQILACGSVRPTNLNEILSKTNVQQFHMAPMCVLNDTSMDGKTIKFNGAPRDAEYTQIDETAVREAMEIVKR